ncbi:MAG TPA: DUF748 domain-containing protein [Candidatus Binatia bacterium]|jgi:hypothetical protein
MKISLTRRQKKWGIITGSVVLALLLIITFLPMVVRKVAVSQIAAATKRNVAIEDIDINLFTKRIAIKGFRLADKTRPDAFVQFKDLALKFYYLPLFRGHLKLAEFNLVAPAVNVARTGANEFSFSDLLAGEKKETKEGGIDVTVDRFKLSEGIIVLEDSAITPAKSWKAEGLNFDLADISTRKGGPAGKATLYLTLAGTPISINASDLYITPTNGQAVLEFEGFDLALLLPYVPSDTPATLQSGRLSVALALKYGGEGTHLDGDVRLEKLAVLQQGKERPFLSAPELKINLRNINVNNGVFNIATVEVSGDPTVVDMSLTPPSQFDLNKLKVAVEKLTWPQNEPATLQINSQLPKGGALDIGGTFTLKPVKADLKVRLKDADLSAYQRYIPISTPLAGRAETDLAVVVSMEGALQASAKGRASVSRLVLGPPKTPVVAIEQANVATIDINWPGQIKIARVQVRKPSALIERNKDGTLPLRTMLAAPGSETKQTAAPGSETKQKAPPSADAAKKQDVAPSPPAKQEVAATPKPKPSGKPQPPKTAIDIGEIVVEEGFARFIDRTGEQPYTEELSRLAMSIKGLSNAPGKKGRLTLQSVIGATGAFSLQGEIAPLGETLWLDLDGELRDFAIPRVNPYANALLSWIARDGQLGTKVHFKLDGDKLDAKTEIVVGRLDLVQASDDDKAKDKIGLPLGLIVALMKDARGEIRVNVPVSGSLSAPEFSLSEAIWTAVKNVIVNVLAAPFRAIGRLFTSGDKITGFAIDPVRFEPGGAALNEAMGEQLAKVHEFLRNSPFVRLSLSSVVSEADLGALKTQEVTAKIQAYQRAQNINDLAPAAQRYFRQRFPKINPPETVEGIVAALRDVEPRPEGQAQKLAARRVEVVRERLGAAGTDAKRLEAAAKSPAADAKGDGRVEFSVVP